MLGKLHPLFIMVGLPNSVGNQAQRGSERKRESLENSKIKTNHALFLFSLLLRLRFNYVSFLCFCCIRDSLYLFQVKEEWNNIYYKRKKNRKEKKKKEKRKEKKVVWNGKWEKGRATAHGIYSSNITPLMFPDMEWEHRTCQQLLQIIKRTIAATYSSRANKKPIFMFQSSTSISHPQTHKWVCRICKIRTWIWFCPLMQNQG